MKVPLSKKDSLNNKSVICLTAYKAYILLYYLMKTPLTLDEIISIFRANKIINKEFSKDTIRITINTLRASGCNIAKPTSETQNRYVLKKHPFGIKVSEKQIKALVKIRSGILSSGDWKLALSINDFYKKLKYIISNEEVLNLLEYYNPLNKIDQSILKKLIHYCNRNLTITIKYHPTSKEPELLKIICDSITYENNKLYLWCYSFKYKIDIYLRLDKIIEIITLHTDKANISHPYFYVTFDLFGNSISTFEEEKLDEIIDNSSEKLRIRTKVMNEFNFLQRLFNYGSDCIVIDPPEFIQKYLKKIKDTRKLYSI